MTKRKKRPAEARKPINEVPPSGSNPENWGSPPQVHRFDEHGSLRPTTRGPQAGYFAHLIDNGDLTPVQVQAGQEIAEVYLALVGGFLSRAQRFERVDRSTRGTDWPEHIADAWKRYKPWADAMDRQRITAHKPGLSLVIDAVVECRSLREMAMGHGKRRSTIKRLLIEALQEYCRMAGWERKPARMRVSA